MGPFLWVCLGSAAGGGARYLMSAGVLKVAGTGFPYGTLAVNFIGSLLLAALMVIGTETTALPQTVRVALATGLMGGFTTYSTFSYETLRYLQDGAWAVALANVLITVCGCLFAAWLGWVGARWLVGI